MSRSLIRAAKLASDIVDAFQRRPERTKPKPRTVGREWKDIPPELRERVLENLRYDLDGIRSTPRSDEEYTGERGDRMEAWEAAIRLLEDELTRGNNGKRKTRGG